MYKNALDAGAIGGKLLGAGGGGFMAFFVEQDKQDQVIRALEKYLHVPICFDFDGSKIIIYQPNSIMDGE